MKTIIIEDEKNVRSGFLKMLQKFCPAVEIVGEAESVSTGLELIYTVSFELLFLDINLPDGSGFDLLHLVPERDFNVIFVTAYDQYALDAFKVSASDYLMKPVSPDALITAVKNIQSETSILTNIKREILDKRLAKSFNQSEKIIIKDNDTVKLVSVNNIINCKADGSYTHFKLAGDEQVITSINLKEYERILMPYGFIRCHHSYLVNLEHIKSIEKQDSVIILSDNTSIPMSTRKKSDILASLKNRFIG